MRLRRVGGSSKTAQPTCDKKAVSESQGPYLLREERLSACVQLFSENPFLNLCDFQAVKELIDRVGS